MSDLEALPALIDTVAVLDKYVVEVERLRAENTRLREELRLARQWDDYHPAYVAGGKAALWRQSQPDPSLKSV